MERIALRPPYFNNFILNKIDKIAHGMIANSALCRWGNDSLLRFLFLTVRAILRRIRTTYSEDKQCLLFLYVRDWYSVR